MILGLTAGLSWALHALGGIGLESGLALCLLGLTETGGSRLVPILLLAAVLVWVSENGLRRGRSRREALVMVGIMAVGFPALAVVNERIVKSAFAEPRPSHRIMVEMGLIEDLDSFYCLTRSERRRYLSRRVAELGLDHHEGSFSIHPAVLEHWIHEVGYSFPSGHAFNAFISAVVLLGGTLAHPARRRVWLTGVMFAWAVGVGLSRVLLLVHRPMDVTIGAVAGAACGVLLLVPWWRWTQSRA